MSNNVWDHNGSSDQGQQRYAPKKSSPGALIILAIGAIAVLVGGTWKVLFSPAVGAVAEGAGNDFSSADVPLMIIIAGFVLVFIGGYIINKSRKRGR